MLPPTRSSPYRIAGFFLFLSILLWFLSSRALGVRVAGWWQYPTWWPAVFPSFFQLASLLIPLLLYLGLRRFHVLHLDPAMLTVIGGMTLFPQDPHTDVAFITLNPVFEFLCAGIGLTLTVTLPPRLHTFGAVLFPLLVSLVLLPLSASHDPEGLHATVVFYLWHLAIPAQTAGLLLSRITHGRSGHLEGAA